MAHVDDPIFREIQPVPRWWRVLGVAGCLTALLGVVAPAVVGGSDGPPLMLSVTLGSFFLAVLWMMLSARLTFTVQRDTVEVRWWLLAKRVIPRADISSAEAVTYNPMREFGGWGIRFGRNGSRAYSMSGNLGAELTLKNGKRVLLGSRDPEPLVAALRS
jgi:hypothetical protein